MIAQALDVVPIAGARYDFAGEQILDGNRSSGAAYAAHLGEHALRRLEMVEREAADGDLEATSKGEMIAAQTEVKGSAGYVAMERVTGTLQGRKGSFVLQHSGTMNRGVPQLSVTVVPDSGTEELRGIAGTMDIIIAPGGKHSYEFTYTIE